MLSGQGSSHYQFISKVNAKGFVPGTVPQGAQGGEFSLMYLAYYAFNKGDEMLQLAEVLSLNDQ